MRQVRQPRLRVGALRVPAFSEQRSERSRADAETESAEEIPARQHQTMFAFRIHNLPLHLLMVPRFSYHFRFAVDAPMQATSGRPSPFKSATAHPAAAITPSSKICRDQRLPVESSADEM